MFHKITNDIIQNYLVNRDVYTGKYLMQQITLFSESNPLIFFLTSFSKYSSKRCSRIFRKFPQEFFRKILLKFFHKFHHKFFQELLRKLFWKLLQEILVEVFWTINLTCSAEALCGRFSAESLKVILLFLPKDTLGMLMESLTKIFRNFFQKFHWELLSKIRWRFFSQSLRKPSKNFHGFFEERIRR